MSLLEKIKTLGKLTKKSKEKSFNTLNIEDKSEKFRDLNEIHFKTCLEMLMKADLLSDKTEGLDFKTAFQILKDFTSELKVHKEYYFLTCAYAGDLESAVQIADQIENDFLVEKSLKIAKSRNHKFQAKLKENSYKLASRYINAKIKSFFQKSKSQIKRFLEIDQEFDNKDLEAIIRRNKQYRLEINLMAASLASLYLADMYAAITQSTFLKGYIEFHRDLTNDFPLFEINCRYVTDAAGIFLFNRFKNVFRYFKSTFNNGRIKERFTKHFVLAPYDLAAATISTYFTFVVSKFLLSDLQPIGFGNSEFDYFFRTSLLAPLIYSFYTLSAGALTLLAQPWKVKQNWSLFEKYHVSWVGNVLNLSDSYGFKSHHLMAMEAVRIRKGDAGHQRLIYHTIKSLDANDSFISHYHQYLDRKDPPETPIVKYTLEYVKSDFDDLLKKACFSLVLGDSNSAKIYAQEAMKIHNTIDIEILFTKILILNGESSEAALRWKEIMKKNEKYVIDFPTCSKNPVSYLSSSTGMISIAIKHYETLEAAINEAKINEFIQSRMKGQEFGVSEYLTTISYERNAKEVHANIFYIVNGNSLEFTVVDAEIISKSIDCLAWLNVNVSKQFADQIKSDWSSIESRLQTLLGREKIEELKTSSLPVFENLKTSQDVFKIDHNPRNTMWVKNNIYRIDTEASRLTPIAVGLCDALYMLDIDDSLRDKMIDYFADRYNDHLKLLKRSGEKINQDLDFIKDKEQFKLQVLSGVIARTLELFQPIMERPKSHYIIEGLLERSTECISKIKEQYPKHYNRYEKHYETLRSNIQQLQELMTVNSN